MNTKDVCIIGAGPAGIAAAIQLKRCRISPAVFETDRVGGLVKYANLVENYPGFPNGISGEELSGLFREQFNRSSIDIIHETVEEVNPDDNLFRVKTTHNSVYCRYLIVASGTRPGKFDDFPLSGKAAGRLFYDPGLLRTKKGKSIAIVGAGDAAFDYALSLSRGNDIIILNRREKTRCLPVLSEKIKKNTGIKYQCGFRIVDISGSESGIVISGTISGKAKKIYADYLLFAIGREPALDFFPGGSCKHFREKEREGYLYFAGDVKRGLYRQVAISVGDGVIAAMRIYRKIREGKIK